jgi:hypothetical protein
MCLQRSGSPLARQAVQPWIMFTSSTARLPSGYVASRIFMVPARAPPMATLVAMMSAAPLAKMGSSDGGACGEKKAHSSKKPASSLNPMPRLLSKLPAWAPG